MNNDTPTPKTDELLSSFKSIDHERELIALERLCRELERSESSLATERDNLSALLADSQELLGKSQLWEDISTAPKSGWFLALRAPKYTGPTSCRVAVIHRKEGIGFGPWEGSEEAYYKADFFSHWLPFPNLPAT